MASVGLNGASLALATISSIFFIIGCVGYANQRDAVQNTAWFTASQDSVDYYFGLRYAYIHVDISGFTFDGKIDYSDDACGGDACDKCTRDGKAAFGLTVISTIFAVIVGAMSAAGIAAPNKMISIANVFLSFVAAVFSLIAIGLFMGECYNAIKDDSSGDDDDDAYYYDDDSTDDSGSLPLKWGPGGILTIIGMLMMWIVLIFQIAAAAVGGSNQA